MFELLSSLKPRLPGFGRHCWRSQARQYAKEHPEYRDIKSWEGDETGVSDILYRDQSGVFTNALVKRGYLKGESCHNVKPTYHIEVKATTRRNHAEEFYMGKRQYEKVRFHVVPIRVH